MTDWRPVVASVRIDIWSDVVCPFCYIGKRRFERALDGFAHADAVEVIWHSFELDAAAPAEVDGPVVDRLAAKYGMTREAAQRANDSMTEQAAGEGLDFHFELARSGNTFDAHRLIHLAADRGRQDAVKERFLRGYFTEGAPVGDHEALVALAVEAGLEEAEVRATLSGDDYADAVRADEAQAQQLGISGVPFFVVDGRYGISGAQPTELFTQALNQAWSESHPSLSVLTPTGGGDATCADGSCAV